MNTMFFILFSICVLLAGLYCLYKRSKGYGAGWWWGGNKKSNYSGEGFDWIMGGGDYGGFIKANNASETERGYLLIIGLIGVLGSLYVLIELIK